jgi:hypothetical protein
MAVWIVLDWRFLLALAILNREWMGVAEQVFAHYPGSPRTVSGLFCSNPVCSTLMSKSIQEIH